MIPSRAGFATATLVSITDWRSPANYHLPSDIPANLDYGTVAGAARVTYELARTLAAGASKATRRSWGAGASADGAAGVSGAEGAAATGG